MAGGGAPVPEGSGGKKNVDFQVNLIPMIDLLSVLISFLLMTAVWTQISRIDVRQTPNLPSDEPTPPQDQEEKLNLAILIKDGGYTVTKKGQVIKEIEKRGEEYDTKTLSETLKQVYAEHGEDAREVQVTSEDKVSYQALITVMDICLEHGMDGISVAGVDG